MCMEIKSLCVCELRGGSFANSRVSRETEVKTLPILSVVQSVCGSYRISVDGSPETDTGEMGVFVAPRQVIQRIRHIPGEQGTMDAHWVFLDVDVNSAYKLDDLYDFPVLLPPRYGEEIYRLIREIQTQEDLPSRLPAAHRILAILLETASPKPHIPEDMALLRNYVEKHYMEPITPEDLADILHCSRSAMYRRFQQYFQVSPSRYINTVRIRWATFLLTETNLSVGEVAAAVGIHNLSFFARLFRATVGETAVSYRRRRKA